MLSGENVSVLSISSREVTVELQGNDEFNSRLQFKLLVLKLREKVA